MPTHLLEAVPVAAAEVAMDLERQPVVMVAVQTPQVDKDLLTLRQHLPHASHTNS